MLQHEGEGVLAMANTGANTNASQFQITCGQFPFLDGKHVVFGQIVHGLSVLRAIEAVPRGPGDRPSVAVAVSDCGELSQEQYEQLLPSLAPEPQPRNLSVPTLTPVTKPSSGAGPGSSAGAGGVAGSAPKGRAAIGGAGPGSAISGSDTLFDLGGKAMLDFDEIMKKIDPSKLDVDGK